VLHALVSLAASEGEESSKTLFYILGGVLVAWALLVSAVGIARHETFPPSPGAARAVMGISVVLVLGAMASAVITG
jgi:hypothetical protein